MAGRKLRKAKRKARKAGEKIKKEDSEVRVVESGYMYVEGFCKLCGAKIYGDIPLISHTSEKHDERITLSKYLSMGEDEKFKTIRELALKYLTLSIPKWYRGDDGVNILA